jgi:hypothetical protein
MSDAQVKLTLADLGVLAATAHRNGTGHAFVDVAMQWAGQANEEIERLRSELLAAREDARRYAWLRDVCLQQPNKSRAVKVHEFVGPIAYGDTIDAAIDSAMKGDCHG